MEPSATQQLNPTVREIVEMQSAVGGVKYPIHLPREHRNQFLQDFLEQSRLRALKRSQP